MNVLIVVDYQNDFVDGSLGFSGAEKLDEKIADKIKCYHKNDDIVIFTMDTHFENYLETQEGRKLPVKHCIKGTNGWELFGQTKLSKKNSDIVFEKNTFPSLELGKFLEGKPVENVELVGLVSNICVISNAVIVKSALPEAEIVVDANLTASNDKLMHEKCLDVMESLQIKVINRKL